MKKYAILRDWLDGKGRRLVNLVSDYPCKKEQADFFDPHYWKVPYCKIRRLSLKKAIKQIEEATSRTNNEFLSVVPIDTGDYIYTPQVIYDYPFEPMENKIVKFGNPIKTYHKGRILYDYCIEDMLKACTVKHKKEKD